MVYLSADGKIFFQRGLKVRTPTKKAVLKYFKPVKEDKKIIEEAFDFDLEDSLGHLAFQKKSNTLFLSKFSADDIFNLMDEVGLVEHLKAMGLDDLKIDIEKDESLINYLKVYYREKAPENILIDLRLSDTRFIPDKNFFEEGRDMGVLDMILIEWLSAQHPSKSFDPNKPQLPGQKKPGLGSLNYMMDLMYLVGKKIFKDGFMDVPDHFHGAVMYSRKFKFFNPNHEAILRAVLRDLKNYSLADIAWGIITKTIIDKKTGEHQEYQPSEQIFPLSQFMNDYFDSKKYQDKFTEVYRNKNYHFDYEKMLEIKNEYLQNKSPEDL